MHVDFGKYINIYRRIIVRVYIYDHEIAFPIKFNNPRIFESTKTFKIELKKMRWIIFTLLLGHGKAQVVFFTHYNDKIHEYVHHCDVKLCAFKLYIILHLKSLTVAYNQTFENVATCQIVHSNIIMTNIDIKISTK